MQLFTSNYTLQYENLQKQGNTKIYTYNPQKRKIIIR